MKVFGVRIERGSAKKAPARDSVTALRSEAAKSGIRAVLRAFEQNPELQIAYGAKILKIDMPDYLEQVAQKVIAASPELQVKLAEARIQQMIGGSGPKSLKDQIMELKEMMALVEGSGQSSGFLSPDIMQLIKVGIESFGSIVIANNPGLAAKVSDVAQRSLPQGSSNGNSNGTHAANGNGHAPAADIDYTNNIEVFKHYLDILMNIVNDDDYSPEDAARIALHELNRIALAVRPHDPEMRVADRINDIVQQPPQILLSSLTNLMAFAGNDPRVKLTIDRLSTEEGMEYLTRFHEAVKAIYAEVEAKGDE